MRWALRVVLALVAVAILCVAAGTLVPRPLRSDEASGAAEGPRRQVLVLSNPIHTDIALPADPDVLALFAGLADARFPLDAAEVRWLVFGWGGRSFYIETPTWADLKPMPVLRALTIDSSVMHVALAGDISTDHPAVTPLLLDSAAFEALAAFVRASFRDDADGRPVAVAGGGYGPHDRFYEAHGDFNALLGCNVWTARALRRAGLRTGWWNPLPTLLRHSLSLHNR